MKVERLQKRQRKGRIEKSEKVKKTKTMIMQLETVSMSCE